VTIPATASGDSYAGFLASQFVLQGDFEAQVEFSLPVWPALNGVYGGIYIGNASVVRGSFPPGPNSGEGYEAHIGGMTTPRIKIPDSSGALRLKRTGNTVEAFYWANGWQSLGSSTDSQLGGAVTINIGAHSHPLLFQGQTARIALDNFKITNSGLADYTTPNFPEWVSPLLLD
jgi:hypothetical protein